MEELDNERLTPTPDPVTIALKQSYRASRGLASVPAAVRDRGLGSMAAALQKAIDDILEANTLDLETSREMVVPELLLEWLKLTRERLETTVNVLRCLEKLPDPLQYVSQAIYQIDASQTYCQRKPLGVVALISESLPELGAIAAGLCVKTGNSLLLRGGNESSHTNMAIAKTLQVALDDAGIPTGALQLLNSDSGASAREVLLQSPYVNLVIPYGRPSLIQQTLQLASVPILPVAMGNCYLYWSATGDAKLVSHAIIDSHSSEPDPVNAIEKVLISDRVKPSSVVKLFHLLQEAGFKLRGDRDTVVAYSEHLTLADEEEWSCAYLEKIVAFKIVSGVEVAIGWIERESSGHADCFIGDSYREIQEFTLGVSSASIYVNASPRFERFRNRGEAVFLGMSNKKGYGRGFIGLESLSTSVQVIRGESNVPLA